MLLPFDFEMVTTSLTKPTRPERMMNKKQEGAEIKIQDKVDAFTVT